MSEELSPCPFCGGEAEFDRAVMQVLCGAMALMLSGRLQTMEVDA